MADETLQSHAQNEAGSDSASKPRIPVGSFEILYCEKCGCMIPGGAKKGNAIASGEHWICKKCSRATQGTAAAAANAGASGSRATAVRQAPAAAPAPQPPAPMRSPEPEPAALRDNRNGRKPSGQRITPMGRRANTSSRSRIIPEHSGRGRRLEQDAPLPPADGGAKATKVAMIAVAAVAVVVLGFLFMSGGSENRANPRTESSDIPKASTTPPATKPVETNSGGGMSNQEIINRLTRKNPQTPAPRHDPPAVRPTPAATKTDSSSGRPGGLLSSIGTGRPGEPLGTPKNPAQTSTQPAPQTETAPKPEPAVKPDPEPVVEAGPAPREEVAAPPEKKTEQPPEEPKKDEPKMIAPPSGGSILDPTAVPGP